MEELRELLKKAAPKVDWDSSQALVDDGILDSIDIISVVSELTVAYGIEIPSEEMEPDNFNSVTNIYDMVQRLLDE